ncbi:hypothetical protein FGF1_17050 [Flavobacteriaceae bacterium GF1]
MKNPMTLFIVVLPLFLTAQSLDIAKTLDSVLSEVDPNGPGVAIGIVKEGVLVLDNSKGLANLDHSVPIDSSTNFRLSSSSKQFTAACILHLVENGQLKLEDPLSEFFPEFSKKIGNVTIKQLLNHTSGIRDYLSLLMLKGSEKMDFFNNFTGNDVDLINLITKQKGLSFESGSQHDYSNTNYWLLGQIVKKVSGKSLGTYAKDNIFTPLGMHHTTYMEKPGSVWANKASGYVSACPDCERTAYEYLSPVVGDGGVVSSIKDLVKWENEFHSPKLFSKSFWNSMLEKGKLENGKTIAYASGLIVGEFNGETMVSHSGQNPGFSSDLVRFPEHHLSILVLGNQNWYNIRSYAMDLAKRLLPDETQIEKHRTLNKERGTHLTTNDLDIFCGDFHFLETNEYRSIQRENNRLIYVRPGGPSSNLLPLSKTKLTFEERPNVTLTFDFKASGEKRIVFEDGPITLNAKSYVKASLTKEDLVDFNSKYVNGELGMELILEMENDLLMFPIFGQKFPLEALTKDQFSAMGMFTLKFQRNEMGHVIGFNLDAPRAKNIVFKKN